jgi:tol-pal system beta propeller repeat protein TolB
VSIQGPSLGGGRQQHFSAVGRYLRGRVGRDEVAEASRRSVADAVGACVLYISIHRRRGSRTPGRRAVVVPKVPTVIVMAALLGSGCSGADDARPTGGRLTTEHALCRRSASSATTTAITGRIAFTSDRDGNLELYLMDPDGSDLIRLTNDPEADMGPAWSPDGTKIAFTAAADFHDLKGSDICVMRVDGSGIQNLSRTPTSVESGPAWSPDGRRIAFNSDQDGNDEIYVMEADGSNPTRLTTDPAGDDFASWSPDGHRILFTSDRGGGREQLWVMSADGSGAQQLTREAGGAYEAAWSPDGTRIAFVSALGDPDSQDPVEWNEEILVMRPDGSGVTQLTRLPGNDHWPPTWSPDARRLAFTSDGRHERSQIYVMSADGSNPANVTKSAAQDAFPAWQPK